MCANATLLQYRWLCPLGVIRDRDEASNRSRHVGYVPESGSKISVLAPAAMGLCGFNGGARHLALLLLSYQM